MSLNGLRSLPLRKRVLDLGLYGHSDYARFIILGRSRVGSNLLRGLLNSHPAIAAFGEIFRETGRLDWDHMGYFQSRGASRLLEDDPVQFVDERVFGGYPRFIQAVGFKLFYYHAREGRAASVWRHLGQRRDLKVIHLKRRNLLHTHLSRKQAALANRWVDTAGGSEEYPAVSLDYDECLRDFQQTRAWEEESDRFFAGQPKLEVLYERLAGDYPWEVRSIQEFLGVAIEHLSPETHQQARRPLSGRITNYEELKRRFGGSPWAEFFTE